MLRTNVAVMGLALIVAGAIILRLLGYRYDDHGATIVMAVIVIALGAFLTSRWTSRRNR